MNWLQENWFKLGFLVVILIIAISTIYHFIIFPLNQGEQTKQQMINQEMNQEISRNILEKCLSSADWTYLSIFERLSRTANPQQWENIPVSISLQNITGDTKNQKQKNIELWRDARNECYLRYPVN